jgi:hypothetical protein
LLASAKAFSVFFALASADFCDFSALALAAMQYGHWPLLEQLQSSKGRKEVK